MSDRLDVLTNQYPLSKTLRFELKPVGATADWIRKHNVIRYHNGKLVGKDAIRFQNYKYLKKMLDEMHRLFLQQALVLEPNSNQAQELTALLRAIENNYCNNNDLLAGDYPSLSTDKTIKISNGLSKLTTDLFDKKFEDWAYQYKEDMPNFWRQDIAELEQKLQVSANAKDQKFYKGIIKKLKNKIQKSELKAETHKGLYSPTESLQLLEWLVRRGDIKLTYLEIGKENEKLNELVPLVELKDIHRNFNNFATYLSGFSKNRENVYSTKFDRRSGYKATSVIARTFEQNLMFCLGNIAKWHKVTEFINQANNYELLQEHGIDWNKQIAALEHKLDVCLAEFFALNNFSQTLAQQGIEKYNQVLAGIAEIAGQPKTQGLNELINLARQKLSAKRSQLPTLQLLYKQILSKGDKPFIDDFKSDQELIAELNEFVSSQIHGEHGAIKLINHELESFINEARAAQQQIYVPKDKLTELSLLLTGSWQAINQWRYKLFDQKQLDKQQKQYSFSLAQVERWLATEVEQQNFYQTEKERQQHKDTQPANVTTSSDGHSILTAFEQQVQTLLTNICVAAEKYRQLSDNLTAIDKQRESESSKGFEQIAVIKTLLDACNELNHFLARFTVNKKDKLPEDRAEFWYEKLQAYIDAFPIYELYNKVRNYLSKKPFSTEKVKINFDNSHFLSGWTADYERHSALLFKFNENYLLGVVNENLSSEEEEKLKLVGGEEHAKRFIYDFQKIDNSNPPRVFIRSKGSSFAPAVEKYQLPIGDIIDIYDQGKFKTEHKKKNEAEFKDSLVRLIDYFKLGFSRHDSYKHYPFKWKASHQYSDIAEFYAHTASFCYTLKEENINFNVLRELSSAGKVYLFEIYNKDFSKNKRGQGRDNLHTSYWKLLFSAENLKDVVLKLNGQAEIFYRPASLAETKAYTHKKGEVLKHKAYSKVWEALDSPIGTRLSWDDALKIPSITEKTNHNNQRVVQYNGQEIGRKAEFAIIKNRRYSVDKFLFHCPITLNFKANGQDNINARVNQFLANNKKINIIGIDRGEKHLLYISVINQQGEVLHQESFNTITNSYQTANGEKRQVVTDYHQKLDMSEDKRDKARKSWSTIENIKELKAGYLSHVVHRLAQLIIEFNAIVALEDLNHGFKRGRFKIEKQVYQKFEKALIDKLSYLAFKDRTSCLETGHYLNAFQLTSKFKGFNNLGKQSGILFYVNADYTSTTDPLTGYIKNVYKTYSSVKDSTEFWQRFNSIRYIASENRFEFSYDLADLKQKSLESKTKQTPLAKTQWTVSSHVTRSYYNQQTKQHELFEVTARIQQLLSKAEISYQHQNDLIPALASCQSKALHKELIWLFNSILTMRVTDSSKPSATSENDFILSPVAPYFDSRNLNKQLPENGDANGAYNIARKGIMLLERIGDFVPEGNKKYPDLLIRNNDWQNFVQRPEMVNKQKKKLVKLKTEYSNGSLFNDLAFK
ncbi:type V CRISPR-associated protein Cpf1 [Saccharobesus litoralis]|uniref:Type V CRISPR-associated protein Cpf1 n=1 Tax=Saccharobesus litoralis TaxID=2172099 RepID=A0A2S0VW63_9ALTE|nr:type V CRISPR-associated protein Cas12a/Cpf1 [Saccharobesus litoralis]AWB68459.1 type V CRISPR-associated protein Cpf1 [Saccharobesus litoralis]